MYEFQKISVDSKAVEKKLSNTNLKMPSISKKMMHAANKLVKKQALSNAKASFTKRKSKDDGKSLLLASTFKDFSSKSEKFASFVSAKRFYAPALEKGAVIRAKNAKYLHIKINGEWRTVSSIILPAKPFLGPAVKAIWESEKAITIMEDELNRLLSRYWERQG